MERNVTTFPVRIIGLCSLLALNIAVLITGVLTEKLWIWLITLIISAVPILYFRSRNKKVLSDYFHRKRQSKRNVNP